MRIHTGYAKRVAAGAAVLSRLEARRRVAGSFASPAPLNPETFPSRSAYHFALAKRFADRYSCGYSQLSFMPPVKT